MIADSKEAAAIWARQDLVRCDGTIKRVGGSFVSLELADPYAPVSVRWPGEPPAIGAQVVVAGEEDNRLGNGMRRGLRIYVVQVRDDAGSGLLLLARPATAPRQSETPPPWLGVLVRHGLLDAEAALTTEMYDLPPVLLLSSLYAPTAALDRGLVHYDWKWRRDTNDPVADFAAIANEPRRFSLLTLKQRGIEFEVRLPDGRTARDEAEVAAGDLDDLAIRMNRWLASFGARRRLWIWDTGGDTLAFLGRSPEEVEAMAREGLPVDGLAIADNPAAGGEEDWSDL